MAVGLKDLLQSKDKPDPICESCLAGKMHSAPFPSTGHRASQPLELVHSDLHGPMARSPEGYRYWMLFVDDHTRFKVALGLKRKSDAFEAILHSHPRVQYWHSTDKNCQYLQVVTQYWCQ